MQNYVGASVLFAVVAGIAFWVVMSLSAGQNVQPPRDVNVLGAGDLRSNIPGQPSTNLPRIIVNAPQGHPEGHVVSTVPRKLPNGEYRFEIDADFKVGTGHDNATCIMDVLADSEIVAKQNVDTLYDTEITMPGVTFQSPTESGANAFQMRLYCDGRANVSVHSVKLIQNPSSPPLVIIQR